MVVVNVVLASNLGPAFPAPQYAATVSEGALVSQEVFTVQVGAGDMGKRQVKVQETSVNEKCK